MNSSEDDSGDLTSIVDSPVMVRIRMGVINNTNDKEAKRIKEIKQLFVIRDEMQKELRIYLSAVPGLYPRRRRGRIDYGKKFLGKNFLGDPHDVLWIEIAVTGRATRVNGKNNDDCIVYERNNAGKIKRTIKTIDENLDGVANDDGTVTRNCILYLQAIDRDESSGNSHPFLRMALASPHWHYDLDTTYCRDDYRILPVIMPLNGDKLELITNAIFEFARIQKPKMLNSPKG